MLLRIISIKKRPLWKRIFCGVNTHDVVVQYDGEVKKFSLFMTVSATDGFLVLHYCRNKVNFGQQFKVEDNDFHSIVVQFKWYFGMLSPPVEKIIGVPFRWL